MSCTEARGVVGSEATLENVTADSSKLASIGCTQARVSSSAGNTSDHKLADQNAESAGNVALVGKEDGTASVVPPAVTSNVETAEDAGLSSRENASPESESKNLAAEVSIVEETATDKQGSAKGSARKAAAKKDAKRLKPKSGSTDVKGRQRPAKREGESATPAMSSAMAQIDAIFNKNRSKAELERELQHLQSQLAAIRKKCTAAQQEVQQLRQVLRSVAKEAAKAAPDGGRIAELCKFSKASDAVDEVGGSGQRCRSRRSITKNGKILGRQVNKKRMYKSTPPSGSSDAKEKRVGDSAALGMQSNANGAGTAVSKDVQGAVGTAKGATFTSVGKGQETARPSKSDRRKGRKVQQQQQLFVDLRQQNNPKQSGFRSANMQGRAMQMLRQRPWGYPQYNMGHEASKPFGSGPALLESLMHPPAEGGQLYRRNVDPMYFYGNGGSMVMRGNNATLDPGSSGMGSYRNRGGSELAPPIEKLPVAESPAQSSDHPISTMVRNLMRSAQTAEELSRAINVAEEHHLLHEAATAKKKLSEKFPGASAPVVAPPVS